MICFVLLKLLIINININDLFCFVKITGVGKRINYLALETLQNEFTIHSQDERPGKHMNSSSLYKSSFDRKGE